MEFFRTSCSGLPIGSCSKQLKPRRFPFHLEAVKAVNSEVDTTRTGIFEEKKLPFCKCLNDLNIVHLVKIWLELRMHVCFGLDSDTYEVELDMGFCQAQAASTSNTSPIKDANPIKDTVETQAPPLKSQKCYIWSYRFLPCLKGDFEARCLVMQFILMCYKCLGFENTALVDTAFVDL